jgi:hypothetical protein
VCIVESAQKKLSTIKWWAVDWSTIQFWTIFGDANKQDMLLKAEIAIASRFRQIKQPIFFVIITPFLDLMVPTGFQLCLYCLHTSLYFWNLSPFVLFC